MVVRAKYAKLQDLFYRENLSLISQTRQKAKYNPRKVVSILPQWPKTRPISYQQMQMRNSGIHFAAHISNVGSTPRRAAAGPQSFGGHVQSFRKTPGRPLSRCRRP